MKRWLFLPTLGLSCLCSNIALALTPGLYEYTIKMNMPGAPADMPAQTQQQCITAADVKDNKAMQVPSMPNSDCRVNAQSVSGNQFSYRLGCTTPMKFDADVKGSLADTSLTMDMIMHTPGLPAPITQNISAKRIGDCK